MDTLLELSMTFDQSNTTALHSAEAHGHTEVVKFLIEKNGNLVTIGRSNKKIALHSAARNEHLEVVKALLSKETEIALMTDKKGQTTLHMAVKGQSVEIIHALLSHKEILDTKVMHKSGETTLDAVEKISHSEIASILRSMGSRMQKL